VYSPTWEARHVVGVLRVEYKLKLEAFGEFKLGRFRGRSLSSSNLLVRALKPVRVLEQWWKLRRLPSAVTLAAHALGLKRLSPYATP
jgi:hypothetical protein